MRPLLYSGVVLALILGGCSTAYKTGQTPDDVYYSPANERTVEYSTNDNSPQTTVAANSNTDGNYVTYSGGDNANDSYNAASNAYDYGYNDPYYGGNYYGSYYGSSYYSPYTSWYPSFSLGFGYGLGYPWLGSYFNAWDFGFGYPYYSYWGGYPYWGGMYYPGYYSGKYAVYSPRPYNSYGPRVGMSSNAYGSGGVNTGSYTNGNVGVRTFNTGSGGGVARPNNNYIHAPRRVFVPAPDERPVNVSNNNRSRGVFRVFRNNNNTYSPQPVNVERPVREYQPARSFEPARTESSSSSAPVRSFSPRR